MQLQFTLQQPAALVFDFLSNAQKLVSVHPVIHKMEPRANNNFLVHETLTFGFIPITFRYPTSVESNAQDLTVIMRAVVMKLVKVDIDFKLKTENNETVVNETINFETILPVKPILRMIFKKQHGLLFEAINSQTFKVPVS